MYRLSRFYVPDKVREYLKLRKIPFDRVPAETFDSIALSFKKFHPENPLISIVLIAWNEEDNILPTLASLADLTSHHPVEIIVVNNNSTDRTQDFLDRCHVKSVFEPRPGIAQARNAGLKAAKGNYIISGDVDTIYLPQWADYMIKPMLDNRDIVCTYSLHVFYDDDDQYPLSLYTYQYIKLLGIYLKNYKRPHLNCGGASSAYRRDVALQIGGYDERLKRGSDGTLAFELSKYGRIKLVSAPQAFIYTSARRMKADGPISKALWIRLKNNLKYFTHYFSTQKTR
ncbi:MAG: glycosyltransferase family 2 protein [Thermaurantimonas sp.]